MTDRPDNPPAFPNVVPTDFQFAHDGMSLRDWFAGKAMQGLLSNGDGPNVRWVEGNDNTVAQYAYELADAMLARRQT